MEENERDLLDEAELNDLSPHLAHYGSENEATTPPRSRHKTRERVRSLSVINQSAPNMLSTGQRFNVFQKRKSDSAYLQNHGALIPRSLVST